MSHVGNVQHVEAPSPTGQRAKHLRSGGRVRPARSKASQLRLRERVANLLRTVTSPEERRTFAMSCDVSPGKVAAWCCEALADGATLPAYAIIHMPKAAREELLHALAEWGDLNDAGDF